MFELRISACTGFRKLHESVNIRTCTLRLQLIHPTFQGDCNRKKRRNNRKSKCKKKHHMLHNELGIGEGILSSERRQTEVGDCSKLVFCMVEKKTCRATDHLTDSGNLLPQEPQVVCPSKHKTLAQRWFTVGHRLRRWPTVNQRWANVLCLLVGL